MINKRGQVTIFILIAILIVAGIIIYFTLKSSFVSVQIPSEMQPVYTSFLACLDQDIEIGISLLETHAGYIELPEFEAGSEYAPFSSQLNFLGNPIPYWYYVSGNNIEKEQIPTQKDMESQLEEFIDSRIRDCEFQTYRDQGFAFSLGEPESDVSILLNSVEVSLDMDITIEKGGESVFIKNHDVTFNSKLGSLYKAANKIYDEEQKELFLEKYAVDNLRLYAPVDGVEISCSPLVWSADEIFNDLQEAIEVNTLALGTDAYDEYFEIDLPVSQEVSFLNSRNWPVTLEVSPSDQVLTSYF